MKKTKINALPACSFCSKPFPEVGDLICYVADTPPYICRECIAVCNQMVEEDRVRKIVDARMQLRFSKDGKLQQLWMDIFSSKSEWRDVPTEE